MPDRDLTKNFARYRVRDPKLFLKDSFKTLDIGEIGHHKLIRGILKSSGEYKTQSVIIERKFDKAEKKETRELVKRAKQE